MPDTSRTERSASRLSAAEEEVYPPARDLRVGAQPVVDVVPPRELKAVDGSAVQLPDRRQLVHLQFRRFAGCPICDLHLHSFVRRQGELEAAGLREIAVFHSTPQELRRNEADWLPFPVIADPKRQLYREFGVEAAPRALLDPRVWPSIVRAIGATLWAMSTAKRRVALPDTRSTRLGLPADFLIASDGRVLASKYGVHADDHWSVDELLALARANR